jgi:hypothetical protein
MLRAVAVRSAPAMSSQQMQENRFEYKYLINEGRARGIRDFARGYLEHDRFADPNKDYTYPIYSLYLDDRSFYLCRSTMQGLKNRFKLRIRYYDDNPASPVYFEIKRRVQDAILKRRAAVRRESVMALLAGHWPSPSDLMNPSDLKARDALQQFCDLRNQLNAQGQVIVSYIREAWVTPENNTVRLTFDRNLSGQLWQNELRVDGLERGAHPKVGGVVLELKFTDRFPVWMRDMAHVFNLERCSMAKYVHCVTTLRPRAGLTEIPLVEAAL